MKKTVDIYSCDNCSKELSNRERSETHITIEFIRNKFGLANSVDDVYAIEPFSNVGILQFCNAKCMGEWIKNKEEDAKLKLTIK